MYTSKNPAKSRPLSANVKRLMRLARASPQNTRVIKVARQFTAQDLAYCHKQGTLFMEAASMGFAMEDFAPLFMTSQLAGVFDVSFAAANGMENDELSNLLRIPMLLKKPETIVEALYWIVKSIERIKQDMNDIYDDIYSISCVEDIQDMLERIQLVCQKGIPQTDLADFEELKKALEAFLADITALTDCQDDRDAFEAQYSTLLKQYSDDEFDFDVVSIIEQVGQSIRESMEAKDLAWRSRYLEPMLNGRVELLSWVDKTRLLPKYLSEETLQSYYERKKDVDQQLSQAKIDDVIYSFRKLEEKEKEACFDQLVDIYKNGGENTNDIDLPFTRNKKWDLEEWIVLVKVYFEHKDKSRSELNELLSPLSLMLVRRADALGIEHDEKYRNINGLAMQFDRIKYMDTKGAKGLSAYSELAEAALKMYHTDREGFELLAKKCWEKYGAD